MKKLLLVLGIAVLGSSLNAQTTQPNPNPIVIDMTPNSRSLFVAPSLYISEQPVSPEAYCAFLNATATSNDVHGLYHPEWNDSTHYPNLLCIAQNGDSENGFTYNLVNQETNIMMMTNGIAITKINPITQQPELQYKKLAKRTIMKGVPMADAARFCNWMFNNQALGPQGNETTETGSYTFWEVNDKGTNGDILQLQKNPHDTSTRELKEIYKSVTRTSNATWRLPSEAELRDVINNWGNVDTGEVFWCWTDDIYYDCWKVHLGGFLFNDNSMGYRRVKNSTELFIDRTKLCIFQDLFVSDTGFRVVFTTDKAPASGFRVFVPSATPAK